LPEMLERPSMVRFTPTRMGGVVQADGVALLGFGLDKGLPVPDVFGLRPVRSEITSILKA